jgi:flavin-dependent dehydrogenase
MECDVAIIGGGPAGSTAGTILKKHNPALRVSIFERETFPRDHVGESLLPSISAILAEMGCWDAVEAAGFPIKVGATYRWGRTPELWDFDFLAGTPYQDQPRPSPYQGQRVHTAFQVDRAQYDQILLEHAALTGCDVYQNTKVARVSRRGDRVESLELESGETVTARHYLDASGASGILRRAMGVESEFPTNLRNVAVWDYWQNAEWAVKIGVGATRIQIMSLSYGWLWFIPLGPTRTSIGLVVPADYLKSSGKKLEQLYAEAVQQDPIVAGLIKSATPENKLQTTKDWSFLARRLAGENWLLVGESAGFADPILSAGLTLTHHGAREAAYTILELDRGKLEPDWLKAEYSTRQSHRISTHIRFADYWYTANSQFKDLQKFTSELAAQSGLDLSPEKAWAWLAQGGFISEEVTAGTGGFTLLFLKGSKEYLGDIEFASPLETNNVFRLNLSDAVWRDRAWYRGGGVVKDACYVRGDRVLPVAETFEFVIHVLQQRTKLPDIIQLLNAEMARNAGNPRVMNFIRQFPEALEAMVFDGWVEATLDPTIPTFPLNRSGSFCRWNSDIAPTSR